MLPTEELLEKGEGGNRSVLEGLASYVTSGLVLLAVQWVLLGSASRICCGKYSIWLNSEDVQNKGQPLCR